MKVKNHFVSIISMLLITVVLKVESTALYAPASAIDWSDTPKLNKLLLKNANVVFLDTNLGRVEAKDIYIEGDKIVSVFAPNTFSPSDDVVVNNVSGKFLIPGLIDAHVHLATFPSDSDSISDNQPRLHKAVLSGVTSVQDMGGDARLLSYLARMTLVGDIIGPEIYYSASFSGSDFFTDFRVKGSTEGFVPGTTPWYRSVDKSSNLEVEMIRAKAIGANIIKIYADVDKSLAKEIVVNAKKQGFPVISHATTFPAKPSELLDAGVDSMTHIKYFVWEDMPHEGDYRKRKTADYKKYVPNSQEVISIFKKMAANGVYLDPTLWLTSQSDRNGAYDWAVSTLKTAHQLGVKFTAGTDSIINDEEVNATIHTEMRMYVEDIGLSNAEALRTATIHPAKLLKLDTAIGKISEGYHANMVILNKNPLIDIRNSSDIDYVISRGKIVKEIIK